MSASRTRVITTRRVLIYETISSATVRSAGAASDAKLVGAVGSIPVFHFLFVKHTIRVCNWVS